jgi:hypothetical protein
MTEKQSTNPLLRIDRRIIWVIIVVLIAVPLVFPLGLPIAIDPISRGYFETIEELPPGSKVLFLHDFEAGLWGEMGAQGIATTQHLFEKDIIWAQVCFYRADCAAIFETKTLPEVDQMGEEYGVDWVNIGYIEGKETAMAAFAQDFTYPQRDHYGNTLDDFPIMQEMSSIEDVDLVVIIQSGIVDQMLRQLVVPYDVKAVIATMGMSVPDMINYYEAGIISGILGGLPGAAQYEFLRRDPGLAIVGMDALSATQLFLLILAVVTNAIYITQRES